MPPPPPSHGQSILASTPQPLLLDPISGPVIPPIEVQPGQTLVIGRSSQSQAVLADESVSRRHAQLTQSRGGAAGEGQWTLTDLGSRHGTYLNAVQLAAGAATPLKHGDLIGIGPWSMRVRISDGDTEKHITTTLSEPSPARLERVERVQERELATVTRNRLNLLIEVAAAVGGAGDELMLAKTIAKAAVDGTGFPRASVLRETGSASEVRVVCTVSPEGLSGEVVDTSRMNAEQLISLKERQEHAREARLKAQQTPIDGPLGPVTTRGFGGKAGPGTPSPTPATGIAADAFSRSLLTAAKNGEVARLTADAPMSSAQSIMALGIQTALCAPIQIGSSVGAYLYLDARSSDGGLFSGSGNATRPAVTLQNDAAAFLLALAKMYGLALNNIARLELEKRQRELERDLQAAREAQKLIMPPDQGSVGALTYAMRSHSGRYVAGDLFDVVDLGEGRVGVFLGDVAGKGISAAMLMATAQTHLSLSLKQHGDAARAVREVNRHVCSHAAESRFISLWLGVFDTKSRHVVYVDAGHGHWLLREASGRCQSFTGNSGIGGIPLGIDEDCTYTAGTFKLAHGDRVVLFSDGVVEQPGGEVAGGNHMFGMDRAIATLSQTGAVRHDVDELFEAVVGFAQTDELADDTTIASICID